MGYDGVELAGLYKLEPELVRSMLRHIGLTPISAHVPLVEMKRIGMVGAYLLAK